MSYTSIETAALTVLRLLANYTATNSSVGDYRILGAGVDRAVVLTPGAVTEREVIAATRRMRIRWVVNLDLYIPFGRGGELSDIAANIRTDRQEILDHLDKYKQTLLNKR